MQTRSVARILGLCCLSPLAPAQVQWFGRTPALQPSPRVLASMAWDGQRLILFGGADHPYQPTQIYDDTWAWDGQAWQLLAPSMRPTAREGHTMAWDPVRQRVLLYGGYNPNTTFHDTWEWDGSTWAPVFAASYPRDMSRPGLAFDHARGRMVLAGYVYATGQRFETWEFYGGHWLNRSSLNRPNLDALGVTLGYDPNTRRVLAFDGSLDQGAPQRHRSLTWSWDGNNWAQLFVTSTPPGRYEAMLTTDLIRNRLVMFGGIDFNPNLRRSDTWEWDGTAWQQLTLTQNPGPRRYAAFGYHEGLGRAVLFGDGTGTWELYNPNQASFRAFGAGCPSSAGTAVMSAGNNTAPWLNESLLIEVAGLPNRGNPTFLLLGFSRDFWGAIPLPFDLAILGATGCALRVSAELTVPMVNLNGTARQSLPIGSDPFLVGASFFTQAFVVDPAANQLGIATSNACQARIGSR